MSHALGTSYSNLNKQRRSLKHQGEEVIDLAWNDTETKLPVLQRTKHHSYHESELSLEAKESTNSFR